MKEIHCDILVVGGGPAGSSTAAATAKHGLKTILIEEHEEIGKPVECAEAIGSHFLPYLPFKLPKRLLVWKINGMCFNAEGISKIKKGYFWSGYAINREKFDKWLSRKAEKAGAKIMFETKCVGFNFGNERYEVTKVYAERKGKTIEFSPNYIVGADGVNSTVTERLGIRNKEKEFKGVVKGHEFKNINLKYLTLEQIFFGDFAPGGYGYIFPLSKSRANVGVAALFQTQKLEEFYRVFRDIPAVRKQLNGGRIVIEKSGEAPIESITDKLQYGNVFLVGDAANQTIKPFVEGILPSVICGHILGSNLPISDFEYRRLINKYTNNVFFESDSIGKEILKINRLPKFKRHLAMMAMFSNSISTIDEIKDMDHDEIKKIITE